MPIPIPGGKLGGGGSAGLLIAVVLYFVFSGGGGSGGFDVPGTGGFPSVPASGDGDAGVPQGPDPEKKQVEFVSFVFNDVQGFWAEQFGAAGKPYENAK